PILVPPRETIVEQNRPTNPLSEALIVVPIRIGKRYDHLLEVIHPAGGGPTAQRGYLRFVAQMADLMSDFLRRQKLREAEANRQAVELLRENLQSVASANTIPARLHAAARACAQLLDAEQAFIACVARGNQVVATSSHATFDSRSEPALICQRLVNNVLRLDSSLLGNLLSASDRRVETHAKTSGDSGATVEGEQHLARLPEDISLLVDEICNIQGCRHLLIRRLGDHSSLLCIALWVTPPSEEIDLSSLESIGGLLGENQIYSSWQRAFRSLIGLQSGDSLTDPAVARNATITTWLTRAAMLGLLAAAALFPVNDNVSATAVLQPAHKAAYYAPASGAVEEIMVTDGQAVTQGQTLLQIHSPQLESQLDQLHSRLELARQNHDERQNQLAAGVSLSDFEVDQLESELEQLRIQQISISKQIEIYDSQLDSLVVRATQPGIVAAWELENSLLHRPVNPGDRLLQTFAPDAQWVLLISVPQRRISKVKRQAEGQEASISFSLASHPDRTFPAEISRVAQRVSSGPGGETNVVVEAVVDPSQIPLKQAGAVARATIRCGTTPAAWLLIRDAVQLVKSKIALLW
ncbi:MAG TPA: hypothetical protein DDW52_21195, partial [Planctomycetaceae bacterium]|nr:hypothetical protein [Planctomycetaceae bacterium]